MRDAPPGYVLPQDEPAASSTAAHEALLRHAERALATAISDAEAHLTQLAAKAWATVGRSPPSQLIVPYRRNRSLAVKKQSRLHRRSFSSNSFSSNSYGRFG